MSDIPTAEPIPARRYAKPKNWKKAEQRANPTHPQLRTWIQHVAGAIHYFADRDGVTRKFPREIADHIGIAEGTIRRNLKQMTAAGAVVIAEPGSRNGWTRPGYRLHESIAAKFPKLSRYSKALIRRVSPWELAAGKSVHKSGKSAGKEWVTSTPESQRWFLQVVGMQAKPPNDECDLDLEELSAACGFLKKKKAYNSQVSNVIRDLEAARRIARIRRFDPVTGACLRTITRLAGESGFIPEHQATAPAATKAHWPKDRSESNAAVLFDVIYELAGGIRKNCHASVRDLAELAFPRKTLKEGKRCVHRAQNVLRRLKCIDWEEGGLDRYRIKALPNCYTVLKLPHWKPETVTPFGLWLDQKMKAFNVSAYKMVKEGGLGKNTVRRMLKSDPRISDDSIDKAIAVLKAHGAQIKTSEIPRP